MIQIDHTLTPASFEKKLQRFWELSAGKIALVEKNFDAAKGAPVFTVNGRYTTRGWTEWTQGFQFGSAVLQYDGTGGKEALASAKQKVVGHMAPHLTHTGVHDHGFNNVSTYGNLLRLMNEGAIPANEWEKEFYILALKVSGAVQAGRWTSIRNGGYIHSFNGPHSLFVDTIRSCRALVISHTLGHVLQEENDHRVNLLERALMHMQATARYSVYYGEGRDAFDIPGRTAHECIFNTADGNFRCPNSQQGYSPFTTWTRGLAWAMCGFAEQLEWLQQHSFVQTGPFHNKRSVEEFLLRAARATCDFYLQHTPTDGIPYWDTGAPGLANLDDYMNKPAEPFNDHEPVDSSAAVIAAQGLLRLGSYLKNEGLEGAQYFQAGLTVAARLLEAPYLSEDATHQGLILHSVYHRPNGWDHVPTGRRIPCGESSMWGDYHARELYLYIDRLARGKKYLTFYSGIA